MNLGSGCALQINDDSALPKLTKILKFPKLPISALIAVAGAGKIGLRYPRLIDPINPIAPNLITHH